MAGWLGGFFARRLAARPDLLILVARVRLSVATVKWFAGTDLRAGRGETKVEAGCLYSATTVFRAQQLRVRRACHCLARRMGSFAVVAQLLDA